MSKTARGIGSRVFVVECIDALVAQAGSVLNFIEREIAQGRVFNPGDTLNIGGMLFSLKARQGELVVGRPNVWGVDILGDDDDVSPLLKYVFLQVQLVKRLGVESQQFNIADKVIVEDGVLSERLVYAERTPDVETGDSGWFVGAVERSVPARPLISIRGWQLLHERPAIVAALALAPGFLVVFDGADMISIVNSGGAEIWRNE